MALCTPVRMAERFAEVRGLTESLAAPLSPEDQAVQSMPDVSPTKWHRAHTTWFFEEFVLGPHRGDYEVFHPAFGYLFNSYYEAVGPRHPRAQRGVVTRPGAEEVTRYRRHVDDAIDDLLVGHPSPAVLSLVELGLHHEQQHQELLLMDIKHVLSSNVLDPIYRTSDPAVGLGEPTAAATPAWHQVDGGVVEIGRCDESFSFDNERPRHQVCLEPFELADRLLTAGEVLEFIDDKGYERPELWLSDGWASVVEQGWCHPMYWRHEADGDWSVFTLAGRRPLRLDEPVVHLSYYEADAIARWAGARLPTEVEWEHVAAEARFDDGLLDLEVLHPLPAGRKRDCESEPEPERCAPLPRQLSGEVWEWTSSPYTAYPGFRTAPGAVGEYNGKFMVNQQVLRGGSCATPPGHVRATYRNFFPPVARWAFSGLRLARDGSTGRVHR